MTATARCLARCDWTAGPGPWRDVDSSAAKHTRQGHATITCAARTR